MAAIRSAEQAKTTQVARTSLPPSWNTTPFFSSRRYSAATSGIRSPPAAAHLFRNSSASWASPANTRKGERRSAAASRASDSGAKSPGSAVTKGARAARHSPISPWGSCGGGGSIWRPRLPSRNPRGGQGGASRRNSSQPRPSISRLTRPASASAAPTAEGSRGSSDLRLGGVGGRGQPQAVGEDLDRSGPAALALQVGAEAGLVERPDGAGELPQRREGGGGRRDQPPVALAGCSDRPQRTEQGAQAPARTERRGGRAAHVGPEHRHVVDALGDRLRTGRFSRQGGQHAG